ncbi:MAG: DUF3095 domain-containing protein [Ignavibacteriales bacterium]|nr:DUF3095 domain-containing protein [Ignavibacteriales bacterium]
MTATAKTNSNSFYLNLPVTENFLDIFNPAIYTRLPDDWHVVATDLKDSTAAIQKGMYKEVNLMGASSIMAMLNLTKSFSLPFVFGGDGATICIPEALVEKARKALIATRKMARDVYGFDFRVGIVPIGDIRQAGFDVLVARYRVSENFVQAVFTGWGLQYAEESIKDITLSQRYNLNADDDNAEADYSGLECRWKNVPSEHGEIVSLIVQATVPDPKGRNRIYREVIAKISGVYGSDTMCHPVNKNLLKSALSERRLSGESNIRTFGKGFAARVLYWFYIRFKVVLGAALMKTGYKSKNIDWGTYKSQLAANTDYRKFDDKLRQTLSGTPEQREELEKYLEARFRKNELVYGTHSAPTALITCLIFSYNGAHIHLVDSDNGGYATAAARLKERLKAKKTD